MINFMDLVKPFSNLEILIKVHLKMGLGMGKENILGKMDLFIMVNGKMASNKDQVFNNIHRNINTQDNLKIVNLKDKEFIPIQMEIN